MTASIYTPDATVRCTVCARPEAEHSRSGGWEGDEARCMPTEHPGVDPAMAALAQRTAAAFRAEVTAETVTDEQIRNWEHEELMRLRSNKKRWAVVDTATDALMTGVTPSADMALSPQRREARAIIAAAINARAKGGR